MCVLHVSFGSKVRPITVGCIVMGSAVLFSLGSRLLVYHAGSGVNSVYIVFFSIYCKIVMFCPGIFFKCRYGCMYFSAAHVLECADVMVMPSTYAMTCTGALGVGKYEVKMFNSVGERTSPWGTPVLN